MIKVSDFIARHLKEKYGIDQVFMVSGGGAMHLNDSFGHYSKYLCNHNEQASGLCGEGYGRFAYHPAVVNVTTGPGGLNALNGLFGAWTDSIPVIFISGQVKYATTIASCRNIPLRQLGDQEVDIISVVKPLTKYAEMVTDPRYVAYHLDKAVWEATHGRKGPVWLDIPHNIQSALIEESEQYQFIRPVTDGFYGDPEIARVVELLTKAKYPVIVAGHGVRLANRIEELKSLLRVLKIPVLTTFNGFDIIEEEHECYVGRIGTIGHRAGNFVLQNADCVLFLGTRNNIRQISYNWENFARKACKIVVDIDEAELLKPTVKPDLAIHDDLSHFIPALLCHLEKERIAVDRTEWIQWGKRLKEKYSFAHTKEYQSTDKINAYHAIYEISNSLDENALCVLANASAIVCSYQVVTVKKGQRYISNSGDASMGFDLPASIGVCISSGKSKVVCITGDGSVMMNIQELQTIAHHQLPIKIFIVNNDGYVSIKQTQNNFFKGRHCGDGPESGVSVPDFVKVAQAFGIRAIKANKVDNLKSAVQETLCGDDPAVCEIMVNPDYIFLPKLSARKLEDGTMISPTLEDMYPFLDREEFAENIINKQEPYEE